MEAMYKGFTLNMDYASKENDPSVDNGYSYNTGQAALINLGYSRKGLGILLSAKSVENMSFRSDRTKTLQDLFINYLPALTKTHTYNLVATLYPYATQPMGEVAFQGEVIYTVKRGSKLGGKYGMPIELNFSTAYAPIHHTTGYGMDSSRVLYKSNLFDKSNEKYWQDFNIKISRKFNKHFGMSLSYYNIQLNNDISKVSNDATGIINSHIQETDEEYTENFANPTAIAYGQTFQSGYGFDANPAGAISRVKFSGLIFQNAGDWSNLVAQVKSENNLKVSLAAKANYFDATKGLFVHALIDPKNENIDDLKIVTQFIENKFIGKQKLPAGQHDDAYVFHNILRGTLDDAPFGQTVSSKTVNSDGYFQFDYSYQIPANFTSGNCHVVVYVMNKNTYEILQAVKVEITP